MFMADNKTSQSGFALLVSLIVVSVVVSVGLVLLDVSIKQIRLSSNSTDSEIAFHAANAGMECAQYWRRQQSAAIQGDQFATPSPIGSGGTMSGITCFDDPDGPQNVSDTGEASGSGDGEVHTYKYEFDWASDDRCTEIDMVVVAADVFGNGMEATNMSDVNVIPGYPNSTLDCPAGSFCTAISAKGYNRNCDQKDSFGTIERDVLLEF